MFFNLRDAALGGGGEEGGEGEGGRRRGRLEVGLWFVLVLEGRWGDFWEGRGEPVTSRNVYRCAILTFEKAGLKQT